MKVISPRIRELQKQSRAYAQSLRRSTKPSAGTSRREFMATAAGLGAAGLAFAAEGGGPLPGSSYKRTLFFNFSSANYSGSTYHLMVAGKKYLLREAASHPALLGALQRNTFLSSLPSSAITHVVEGVSVPTNNIVLSYVMNDANPSTGEYQISAWHLLIPHTGYRSAFQQIRGGLGAGEPLPLSAKRMKYGLPPAATLRDLMEEQELLDTVDFASTLVTFHTELLSADPGSAANIQTNHVAPASNTSTVVLGQALADPSIGPATPQQTPGQDNPNGWATLVPYTDDQGKPMVGQSGANKGLILYDTQWQPETIAPFVSDAISASLLGAKNDTSLGIDVTPGRANIPDSSLTGKIWCRNDGTTSIAQDPATSAVSASASYTVTNVTLNQNGYTLSTPASSGSGAVTLNFENSYLRWLAVYAQFLDKNGNAIPSSQLPDFSRALPFDVGDSFVFLGILTPEFTIYGIPVLASTFSVTFNFPAVASSANILASGLGYGASNFPDTEQVGTWLTSVFNLGLPAFMIAIGVATEWPPIVKAIVIPFITTSAALLVPLIHANGAQAGAIAWKSFVRILLNPSGALKAFLTALGTALADAEITSALEDAIPIVGAVLQAVAALSVLAEITETSCEVVLSPKTYQYTLIGQHDLTVTISPQNNQFPAAAASYQLTAIFDRGAPFVAKPAFTGGSGGMVSFTFHGVPLGGNVTTNVAFYSADGSLVGHGSSAPVANDLNAAPSITITNDLLPITSATQYQHKQKTSLDAQGNHLWICAPAPGGTEASLVCENSPGSLCSLRNITVSPSNNIGYAWQSFSNASCQSGGQGSLDQVANVPNANGSGGNAQSGYALTRCALTPGAKVVYDPSIGASSNFYVDPTNNILRQVSLNPPGFPVDNNSAWGVFNATSSDLLLHPGGAVISINSQISKIETVILPGAPVSDSMAASTLLANLHCGQGKRAGLLNTPVVAAVNAQGTLIVLEATNNRLHALDINGNPVQLFTNQPEAYFFYFSQTGGADTEYLDCAVEFSGLIYVLSRTFGGSSVYRLDIYATDQRGTNPISTTMGFNVSKITVDYWRNVYSLNYEVLKLPNGSLPAVTEPSISQWLPTAPPPCESPAISARVSMPGRPLRRRDLWRSGAVGQNS